jgi:hypothetical protein
VMASFSVDEKLSCLEVKARRYENLALLEVRNRKVNT